MKTKTLLNSLMLALIIALGASCASRGHKREDGPVSGSDRRDLKVEISNKRGESDKMDGRQVFAKYSKAVFMIYTTDGYNQYQGSGFFINANGLAVSNYHVFEGTAIGAEAIKLYGSDKLYKVVEIIEKSERYDFILFRVDVSKNSYIPIARNKPRVGERVYAIGSPLGLENTFSSGEIARWNEEMQMQTSVNLDHGSSGGALINEYGEVVGITSGTLASGSQASVNYAWSIDAIKPYVRTK